jgi:hypothetical protein
VGRQCVWEITRSTQDTAGDLFEATNIKRLPPNEPRSAIYAAMLFGKYPNEIRTTKPLNWLFKSLASVGRALRFKL